MDEGGYNLHSELIVEGAKMTVCSKGAVKNNAVVSVVVATERLTPVRLHSILGKQLREVLVYV